MSTTPASMDPQKLTWAVLLGRWAEFARSALALPTDKDGMRLRDSVPDMIMLQAVWFALQHMDELDARQRSLGIDRAEVLIEKHASALTARWQPHSMPSLLHALIADAQTQLEAVTSSGMRPDNDRATQNTDNY